MTSKSRNPNWGKDETVLALNLFLQTKGKVPDKSDKRVIELSNLLKRNPINSKFSDRENFRSPSSVVLKIGNLQQEADGMGMPNNSQLDKKVWKELGSKPTEVSRMADLIKFAMKTDLVELEDKDDLDDEFNEGLTYTRLHKARERSPSLRKKVLENRIAVQKVKCEICDASYKNLPKTIRFSAFEVHHIIPLAMSGQRAVKVDDLALLCATCHRLIHKLIADKGRWVSVIEARQILFDQ